MDAMSNQRQSRQGYPSDAMVSTHHLTKRYGDRTVVDDLNLLVPRGSVYGFLGPNGSGKSTTMKMLLSLVQPTGGDIIIDRRPMNRRTRGEQLTHIGSLIESPPGYGHLTGEENMRIVQRLLSLSDRQIDAAVHAVRMESQMDKLVRNYSLGMKQRLGIAMALARSPQLLILDEPTNGLDPAGIEEIRELLARLRDQGVTVIVSSHLLGEIDRTCDTLGILSRGRLLFQGTRSQLFSKATPDLLVETDDPAKAKALLESRGYTGLALEDRALAVPGVGSHDTTADIIAWFVSQGLRIFMVRRREQSLEDIFMRLTGAGSL
ncbi:ABC transporter ATP-binding protein [Bifidobacterium stellenboschense]|uniref:ABC transporter ATP-binding protein n=2 Tax=Bifidobacterium stellenboschense TaxID=762211 RepID=A0A087DPG8_9BIFI|nr:ABC transporter ATP-binding protein [Bifidobacterium stellenboschense]